MAGHPRDDFQRVRSPLEGKLVRLRAIEEEDLPEINDGVWDPDVSRYLSMPWPEPLAGTREWWERVRESKEPTLVVETLAGGFVGICGLEGVDGRARSAALGIWLAKPHWEKGYGSDAVRTLCRFGFNEMNLQRIGLAVYEGNVRAVRAYEKVGFKEEGRRRRAHFVGGRHIDVIVMGLLAEELLEE